MRSDTMTNHTSATDTPIRELTDAEADLVIGGSGFGNGLLTAQVNGASPPAVNVLPPPENNTVFSPGYGLTTVVTIGNYPF
jgi:hypothetical protein